MKMCGLIAFAGGVVVGGIVGGAVALMFAPKKGEEFRKDVMDKISAVKRHFADGATVCHEGQCRRGDFTE
ncbi:MAG: YtxH domain-containing protein [Bacteroidaceae bacterium]|nr:YtxH domain-containing protein [Bacteroidaceae bacterium]